MRRGDRVLVKILTRLSKSFRFVGCRGYLRSVVMSLPQPLASDHLGARGTSANPKKPTPGGRPDIPRPRQIPRLRLSLHGERFLRRDYQTRGRSARRARRLGSRFPVTAIVPRAKYRLIAGTHCDTIRDCPKTGSGFTVAAATVRAHEIESFKSA
jgi:hypothetical protein